jgi:transposase-like protein
VQKTISYRYRHFPGPIIQHAVWLYCRFILSLRDVENLLAERGIEVSYETIRRWVARFGPEIAKELRRQRPRAHPQWHLDGIFVSIGGRRMYLWRVVDQNSEVLDALVQAKRDKQAACRLLRKLLKNRARTPRTIVTDKLQSYAAAIRKIGLTGTHHQAKSKNNRIEGSHVPIRFRERKMQRFRTPGSTQRFLSIHAVLSNHFNTRRHLVPASEHCALRGQAFKAWGEVVGVAT